MGKLQIVPGIPLPRHRHITEDAVDELESDQNDDDVSVDITANDTNEDDLPYFARMTNHFLRLVKSSPDTMASRHSVQFPIIADSGANYHMFRDLEFFESISPASGDVILGDGVTQLKIQGVELLSVELVKIFSQLMVLDTYQILPSLSTVYFFISNVLVMVFVPLLIVVWV
jgi:hypothetical protein